MIRRSLVIFSALIVQAAALSAQMHTRMDSAFQLPIVGAGEQYTVDVMINGHGPYTLILDTGTSAIALDLGLVKELDLQKTGDRTENMPFNTKMQIAVYGADSLSFGGLVLTGVQVDGIRFPAPGACEAFWGCRRSGMCY